MNEHQAEVMQDLTEEELWGAFMYEVGNGRKDAARVMILEMDREERYNLAKKMSAVFHNFF